jgi:phage shock protein PspC (stress-responsive transcriptional regulator)
MRKVTTINLNHNAYQVDEEGYEALRLYLESAARALAGNPDREEIMADLEQAIADKCRVSLGAHRTVVSAAEIERIVKEMGPVVGADDSAAQASQAGAASAAAAAPRPRRPYRILEGRMWTGICNGLAAYANVSVTLVRAAFVLLTLFTGGFWFIVYFALLFLMPVADTPEERAAALGQAFNAQELVDRVRQKQADYRARRRARRAERRGQWFGTYAGTPASAGGQPPGAAARIAGGILLPVLTLLSAAWFTVMGITALLIWQGVQHAGFMWPSSDWVFAGLPLWIPLLIVLVVYALFALPIGAGRRAALYYANGGRQHGWADAWAGLLWLAMVALLLVAAWVLLPPVQALSRELFGWPLPGWTIHWI